MKINRRISYCVVVLVLANLVNACGNDLSDLDALAQQNIYRDSDIIEVTAQLSDEQVVSVVAVNSDSEATAEFLVNLGSNEISGQVDITLGQNTEVDRVQIRRGIGGRNGNPNEDPVVPNLIQDSANPNQWHVPDNYLLENADVELLFDGGLYVIVTTAEHGNGELRGQLLLDGQEMLITELSGANLSPEVVTSASGKAFITIDGYDDTIQAIVRVADISPEDVILFWANNPNRTDIGNPLYNLNRIDDYWQLPSGEISITTYSNDIANGKLILSLLRPLIPTVK